MRVFLTIVLLGVTAAAFELHFSRHYERTIEPDTLVASVSFQVDRHQEAGVLSALGKIDGSLKRLAEGVKIEGGNYSVAPRFHYDNGKRYQDGVQGSVSYRLESRNAKRLTRLLARLSEQKPEGTRMQINSIAWRNPERTKQAAIERLRIRAIEDTERYVRKMSRELKRVCKLKKIDFSHAPVGGYPVVAMRATKTAEAPIPHKDRTKIVLNADVKVWCR